MVDPRLDETRSVAMQGANRPARPHQDAKRRELLLAYGIRCAQAQTSARTYSGEREIVAPGG